MPSGYSGAECSCIYKYSLTGIRKVISTKTQRKSNREREVILEKNRV